MADAEEAKAEEAKRLTVQLKRATTEAKKAIAEIKNATQQLWMEVSKVRLEGDKVFIQVSGDKNDKPEWWNLDDKALGAEKNQSAYNLIARGLDNTEQTVIARLAPNGGNEIGSDKIICKTIRIQTK